jgi:hypothetical protein
MIAGAPVQALQQAEALRQDQPTGRGRRGADQLVARIDGEAQRFALDGAVAGQIIQRPDAAGGAHALDQALGEWAAVETVMPFVGE